MRLQIHSGRWATFCDSMFVGQAASRDSCNTADFAFANWSFSEALSVEELHKLIQLKDARPQLQANRANFFEWMPCTAFEACLLATVARGQYLNLSITSIRKSFYDFVMP